MLTVSVIVIISSIEVVCAVSYNLSTQEQVEESGEINELTATSGHAAYASTVGRLYRFASASQFNMQVMGVHY